MYPQYSLKTLLISFVFISLFLCLCVLFWPPANPEDQEGWDPLRIIRSKQALEVLESADKVTFYSIEPAHNLLLNEIDIKPIDYKVVAGPSYSTSLLRAPAFPTQRVGLYSPAVPAGGTLK